MASTSTSTNSSVPPDLNNINNLTNYVSVIENELILHRLIE